MTEPRWCQKIDTECNCSLKHSDKYDRNGRYFVRFTEAEFGDEISQVAFNSIDEAKREIPRLFAVINKRDGQKATDAQIYQVNNTFICNVPIEKS